MQKSWEFRSQKNTRTQRWWNEGETAVSCERSAVSLKVDEFVGYISADKQEFTVLSTKY